MIDISERLRKSVETRDILDAAAQTARRQRRATKQIEIADLQAKIRHIMTNKAAVAALKNVHFE